MTQPACVQNAPIDLRGIDVLPSGRYRLRLHHDGHALPARLFDTPHEAVAFRDAARVELRDSVRIDGESVTQLGRAFLESREGNRSAQTEKQRWKRHIEAAPFAIIAARCVSTRDVLEWLDVLKATATANARRANRPLSWQTRKHCLNLLRAFFRWAQQREYSDANPCHGLKVDRQDGDEDEGFQDTWYLDFDEQRALLTKWNDAELELEPHERGEKEIAAFAIGTGLRFGELACLHLADLHADAAEPFVEVRFGSWDRKRKRFRPPKGRAGDRKVRRVPLFGLALEAARCWLELLPTYASRNPLALVFPTRRGARRDKVPRSWKTVTAAIGVVPRIGRKPWWHLLRHTCASSLVGGWWGKRLPLEDVRAILGHSSVKVTERYAHLAASVLQGVATAAEAAWHANGFAGAQRGHVAVTSGDLPEGNGPVSRASKPPVAGSSPAGRASTYAIGVTGAVTVIVDALRAIGEEHPASLRIAVDALTHAHDALLELAAADAPARGVS